MIGARRCRKGFYHLQITTTDPTGSSVVLRGRLGGSCCEFFDLWEKKYCLLSRFDETGGLGTWIRFSLARAFFPLTAGAKRIAFNFVENLEWDRERRTFARAYTYWFLVREVRDTHTLVAICMLGYTVVWVYAQQITNWLRGLLPD